MDGSVDLHIHTTYSDGVHGVREVMLRARRAGLTTISIVDHDNVGACAEASALGRDGGVEVVSGVELSCSIDEKDIHILGYLFDPENPSLRGYLALFRAERRKRAERIVEKLNNLDIPLHFEAVLQQAGTGSIGRPHIANALVENGYVESYQEAFWKYLGNGKPAYERKYHITPREAIELIAGAGGLSFVAHPGAGMEEAVLLSIIREGIDGIEVVHPSHPPELATYYRGIVSEYFLLASGGSDFHGGRRNDDDALGKFTVTDASVAMMRHRLAQAG
jgi:predicted metal-dependent phosphoesterase TrpH